MCDGHREPHTADMVSRRVVGTIAAFFLGAVLVAVLPSHGSAPSNVDPALIRQARSAPDSTLPVIVRERTPGTNDAEREILALGGSVKRELPIVGSFAASVPAASLTDLAATGSVQQVWGDAHLTSDILDLKKYDTWAANTIWRAAIGLDKVKQTGSGVTVALLDTGISQTPDLGTRVLARVDLTPDHDGLDHFGHGTHMAGIIAGNGSQSGGAYKGVAPAANLVSVKVSSWDGSTDVSVVIAGLQWVIANKATYNIKVLNLSYGTDSTQSYKLDPLDYAVEMVWRAGILAVVSAGNRGPNAGTIDKPGDDPFVLTVGAANTHDLNLAILTTDADFSSVGPTPDGIKKPDILAPGISIVSNRAIDSTIDMMHPDARVGTYYFKGTGSSQATAVVSGVAALLYQNKPSMSPDMMKALIMTSGRTTSSPRGTKLVNVSQSMSNSGTFKGPAANQNIVKSTGTGSLEASRGSFHVNADINGDGIPELVGLDVDVLGNIWPHTSWGNTAWSSSPFKDYTGVWSGWTAAGVWTKKSWHGTSWDATSWDKKSWHDAGWGDTSWLAFAWDMSSWS
jgi:serine protease AprX